MRAAFPACLLALLAWAASSEGRVVGDERAGFAECDAFFYGQLPPAGFPAEQVAKICQRYRGEPRFATLYSTREKIPLYAAFRYTPGGPAGQEEGAEEAEAEGTRWLVEPQIDDPGNNQEEMMPEADIAESLEHLGTNQALMADYVNTGYERGTLNPSCLHKDDHHVATHTLTNAVPLSPPFQELWHWEVEQLVSHSLAPNCENGKDLHLLTGAMPSSLKVKDKIAVPKSVWLAACCDNGAETWSVGFIKEANAESRLEDLTVEDLEKKLPAGAELFKDHCGHDRQDPKKLEAVLRSAKEIRAKKPSKTCAKKPTQSKHTQTAKEGSGFLKNLCHFILSPIWKLVKFVCYLICQLVKGVWCLLKCIAQKIFNGVCTFVKGITTAFLDIFICLARVGVSILNGIAKNIYNVLMVTYRILSVPVNLILDIVSFPFYTLGAIPGVLKDIASGIGGLFLLVINAITSLVKGLNHVVSFLASKILPTTVF